MNNQTNITGNQNIVIQSATNSTINIKINDEVHEIRNDINALKQLLQKFQKDQVQVADKLYNISEIGQANFYNIIQTLPPPQALTYTPPKHEHFLGRTKELRDIYEGLRNDDRPLLLVNGQGGVGKTTLATRYFHEYAYEYAHTAWVTCEGNIADDLISRLQDTLRIRDQLKNIINRTQRTQILLTALASLQKTCLLVLDNANELPDLQAHYKLLRSCPNFHILLTTRINEFREAHFYPIKGLPIEKALQLFREYYPALSDTESQTIRQIHQAVDANTLVIELLAKNLRQLNRLGTRYTLDQLLHDLREKGLLHLQSKPVHTDYGSLQHAKPEDIIAAMYDMNPLAQQERRLLSIFSVLPPENLPFEILENLLPNFHKSGSKQKNIISKFLNFFRKEKQTNTTSFKLEDCLIPLYKKGWIDFNENDKAFKISPVVQGIIRLKQHKQLYEDCETLIRSLIEKLKYEAGTGHPINATYEEAAIYARYGESIVEGFETPTYNLSLLCERIGNYHNTTGDLSKTIFFFEKQTDIFREMLKAEPENTDYKNGLAISYSKLGSTHSALGYLNKALEFFEKFTELMKQLYEAHPLNASFKNGLAIAYEKLGSTHSALGSLNKALEFFELRSELGKQLYESHPTNVSFKNGLAIAYSKLGDTHSALGSLNKALEFFEKFTELMKQLYESHPTNVSFKNGLAIAYSKLGSTHSALGSLNKALEFFEDETVLFEQLYESHPTNVSFKNGLAIAYSKLGDTHSALGSLNKALEFFELDADLTKQLYESHPTNVSFKNGLAISYHKIGNTHEKIGNIDDALLFHKKDLQITKELYEAFPQNVGFKNGLSITYSFLGQFYRDKKDDADKARTYFEECYILRKELHEAFPDYPEFKKRFDWIKNTLGL